MLVDEEHKLKMKLCGRCAQDFKYAWISNMKRAPKKEDDVIWRECFVKVSIDFGMEPYNKRILDLEMFTNHLVNMVLFTYRDACNDELLIEIMNCLNYDEENPKFAIWLGRNIILMTQKKSEIEENDQPNHEVTTSHDNKLVVS